MATATAPSPQLPLFYQSPEALDKEKHTKLSLSKDIGHGFAKSAMAIPVNVVEFPHAMLHYPIAFSTGENPTPLAIVGLKDNINLFIDKKGNWDNETYIPAYVRRYPFIFAEDRENNRVALCVDNAKGVFTKGHKNAFFDNGKVTKLTENAMEFCRSYQRAAVDTENFMKEIKQAGLLIERNAQIRLEDGKIHNINGFMVIDENKFRNLPTETIEKWHKSGALQIIYAHIMSGGNWQKLFNRMTKEK